MFDQESGRAGAEATAARSYQRAGDDSRCGAAVLDDDLDRVVAAGSNTIRAGQEGN